MSKTTQILKFRQKAKGKKRQHCLVAFPPHILKDLKYLRKFCGLKTGEDISNGEMLASLIQEKAKQVALKDEVMEIVYWKN